MPLEVRVTVEDDNVDAGADKLVIAATETIPILELVVEPVRDESKI